MDDNDNNLEKALKNVGKKIVNVLKPVLIKAGIIIGIFAFIIILLAGLWDVILEEFSDSVGEHMTNNNVQYYYDESPEIVIGEEQIEDLKEVIEDLGIDIDNLHLTDDDLTKIYAAEVVSQEINRLGIGEREEEGKYYGRVYVKYAGDSTATEDLTSMYYMDYDKFTDYKDSVDSSKNFSIDDEGLLCVLSTVETTDSDGNTIKTVEINHIDYKTSLVPYLTPVEFLLDLCLYTDNPNFVMAFVDKILNETEIYITILNDTTTEVTTNTMTYQIQTRTWTGTINEDGTITWDSGYSDSEPGATQTEVETTTQKTVTPSVKIAYIKTWYMEQTYTYNSVTSDDTQEIGPIPSDDEEFGTLTGAAQYTDTTITTTATRKVNQSTTTTIETTVNSYQEGITTNPEYKLDEFMELLETPFELAGSSIEQAAIDNLLGGKEMFLQMLDDSERTQTMEKIMEYVLYEYTGEDYGVTSLEDLTEYMQSSFVSVGDDYCVNITLDDSIVVTSVSELENVIKATYSESRRKYLLPEADTFIRMQETYNVNALFAIAVAFYETNGATNENSLTIYNGELNTYNWMNVTAGSTWTGQTWQSSTSTNRRIWRAYSSYAEATMDFGALIAGSAYFGSGNYTVQQIGVVYDNSSWGSQVIAQMTKLLTNAGLVTTSAEE